MPSYNKTVLIGHLTRDPEIKEIPGGSTVCEGGIAVNHKYTKADGEKVEEVSFFEYSIWGKRGDTFNQYMVKGRPVLIEGRLKQDRWEDENGKREKIRLMVNEFTFLGQKSDSEATVAEDAPVAEAPGEDRGAVPF